MKSVEDVEVQTEAEDSEFGDSMNITAIAVAVTAFILALATFFIVKKLRSGDGNS